MSAGNVIAAAEVRFTLCFLYRPSEVLLLLRSKPPNAHKWNGVGGHIEPGEAPLQAVLREVHEETGYQVPMARFCGLLTWRGFEIQPGGLYLFTAPAPAGQPCACSEGLLEWKPQQWAFHNPQVVSNLHIVLPAILNGTPAQVYDFDYHNGVIQAYRTLPLPAWAKGLC